MSIQTRYKTAINPETGKREYVYDVYKTGAREGKMKLDSHGKPKRVITGYRVEAHETLPNGGKRRKTIGTYTKWEDADKADREAKVAIENGVFEWEPPEVPEVITVKDACRTWLGIKKGSVTVNSYKQYENLVSHHIEPAIGSAPIVDLTKQDIQDLVNAWRDGEPPAAKALNPRLIELCLMALRSALEWQVDAKVIASNPASKIVKPKVEKRKKLDLWTEEQTGRFISKAEEHHLAPLWALCLYEGFRRGEALGLRWRDLDWSDDEKECVAHIRQTVIADKANGSRPLIQQRAKTKSSEKPIKLTRDTIRVLKSHRDRQRFLKKEIGEEWQAGDLIVTSEAGTVVFPTNVDHLLKRLCTRADVPAMSPHALRHMAATIMLRAGESPALVQQKLRHSNIQTTIEVYGHLMASDQASVNTALEGALDRARKAAIPND